MDLAPVTSLPYPEVQTLIAESRSEEVSTKHLLGLIAMCSGVQPVGRTAVKSGTCTSFILYQSSTLKTALVK